MSGGRVSVQERVRGERAAEWVERVVREGRASRLEEHRKLVEGTPTIYYFTQNMDKNRFANVVLFDETRVQLYPHSKTEGDYIHASWVTRNYILTQTPKESTLADFWRMVWQENVRVVVSFNTHELRDEGESYVYWPKEKGQKLKTGSLEVKTRERREGGETVTLEVELRGKKETRHLVLLNYTKWTDSNVPSSSILRLMDSMWEHQGTLKGLSAHSDFKQEPPILIQCSTGARRSGTFVALTMICKELKTSGRVVVKETARIVRKCRFGSLQSTAHYGLLYTHLIEYAKQIKEIAPDDPTLLAFTKALKTPQKT